MGDRVEKIAREQVQAAQKKAVTIQSQLTTGNIIKYLIEGTVVALAILYKHADGVQSAVVSSVLIGIVFAILFLLLDVYAPVVGLGSRLGAGLVAGVTVDKGLGVPSIEGMKNSSRGDSRPSREVDVVVEKDRGTAVPPAHLAPVVMGYAEDSVAGAF